jgi:phage-related protein
MVRILSQAEKEISGFPRMVRESLADCLAMLGQGVRLSMPLSRPLPSLGIGLHELRIKDPSGNFRIIYLFEKGGDVWIICAFHKKTAQIPSHIASVIRKRVRSLK